MLQCEQVSKNFKHFHLGPLDATFPEGKITGIFGPNGSGKTTLIALLIGAENKDGGAILNWDKFTFGGVFDRTFLLPHTKVIDQINALSTVLGRSASIRNEIIKECKLGSYLDQRVVKLSTGNKQRLALALALIQDPDVFILDEPLNGLDPEGIEWFNSKLKDLAAKKKTIIFSTHLLAEAEAVVDRCLLIQEGNAIYEGDIHNIPSSMHHPESYICFKDPQSLDKYRDLDTIYHDRDYLFVYDPEGRVHESEGISLKALDEEKVNIPLSALYRLKTHDFRVSGGFNPCV